MNQKRDQLGDQLAGLFEKGRHFRDGAEENVLALVQSQLHKLDVVPREDYDALVSMVGQLENRVAELERQVEAQRPDVESSGGGLG